MIRYNGPGKKRFKANAFPELVFKYRSKAIAQSLSARATYASIFQGLYLFVCEDFPELCSLSRSVTFPVEPIYN